MIITEYLNYRLMFQRIVSAVRANPYSDYGAQEFGDNQNAILIPMRFVLNEEQEVN
jgi:hypothetical protein